MLLDASGAPRVKVAIATPCQDLVHAGYAYDLVRLVATMAKARPDIEISLHQNRGTIIPQQRAVLVRSALEANATHVLWLDSDMRFPPDALLRLLERDQPIVACNYATRRQPILPTAEHKDQGFLFTPPEAEELVEVTRCGMGLMLVQMAVYEAVGQPWFAIGYSPKDGEYSGEDFFFCQKAKAAGFPTLIDQSLSREIKHVGAFEYTQHHAIVTRDAHLAAEEALRGA